MSIPATCIYFDGNAAPGWWQPLDVTIFQIGAVTDYSFGVTVNLRKKQTTVQNDNHCLCSFDFSYGATQGGAAYVGATDGTLNFFFGQTLYTSAGGLVAYETDQTIVMTLTGTTLKGYVQGALVWTQTVVRVATSFNNNSFIGQEGFQFRQLYGTMKNFFAVKSLLLQADVTAIQAGNYPAVLGLWYKCNEGAGIFSIDSSGNRNFGKFFPSSGASVWVDWRGQITHA